MRRWVPVGELKPGMVVVDLDLPWEASPFQRHELRLESESQIARLKAHGSQRVEIEEDGESGGCSGPPSPDAAVAGLAAEPDRPDAVSFVEEVGQARVVHLAAKAIVRDAMEDVRMGREVNTDAVMEIAGEMVDSLARNRMALTSLTRLHSFDEYTFFHCVNVGVLTTAVGRCQGVVGDELIRLGAGALLHDIGKVTIPLEILNKPGKLTKDEYDVIKRHPEAGAEILHKTPGISEDTIIPCLEHQERGDGTGYPYRKTLAEMSRSGLITQVVDVYDALTTDRVYHKARTPYETLRYLYQLGQSGQLDLMVVQQLILSTGIYPVGSVVEFDTGERGIVCAVEPHELLRPRVLLVSSGRGTLSPPFPVVDLSDQSAGPPRAIRAVLDAAAAGIDPARYLDA